MICLTPANNVMLANNEHEWNSSNKSFEVCDSDHKVHFLKKLLIAYQERHQDVVALSVDTVWAPSEVLW